MIKREKTFKNLVNIEKILMVKGGFGAWIPFVATTLSNNTPNNEIRLDVNS